MSSSSIGIYEKAFPEGTQIEEMLLLAKESGYDFFEISIDRTDERISRIYDDTFISRLRRVCDNIDFHIESIGLSALGTYTLGNQNPEIRNKGIDIFLHALIFAKKIGARIIQIPACDVPKFDERTSVTDELFKETLQTMIEIASREGVLIGIENMENDYADTVEKCVNIIKVVNSPYLQLYPDAGNITSASKITNADPVTDMESGIGKYIAFHLKETRPNKYGGLFYGEGHVNFPLLTQKAYLLGVRRFVMEYWFTGNPDWKTDLKKARLLCLSWLGEVKGNE